MSARALVQKAARLAELLGHSAPSSLSDTALLAALHTVGELRRLIDASGASLAGEVGQRSAVPEGLALRLGEKTAADVVAQRARIDVTEARAWSRVGDVLAPRTSLSGEILSATCPAVAAAVVRGDLAITSADRVISTLDQVAPFASGDEVAQLETRLVDIAMQFSPRELARLCRSIPDRFDPDGAEPREDLLRARSGLTITRTPDGLTRWILTMHPEAAGFLTTALDARTAPRRQPSFLSDVDPDPAGDDRTLAQRRLDALVSIARESLQHDPGQVAGSAVTMVVTIPLADLTSGRGAGWIDGVDTPISAATARRLAANADLIPAVLGTQGQPLDLGRTARLYSPTQRAGLGIRDGGCIWTGCPAPPGWCEVAHITPWHLGGRTDLSNGVLLCPFHHRRFDHDGWQLEWHDGDPYLIPPGHIDASRTPRRAGRARVVA